MKSAQNIYINNNNLNIVFNREVKHNFDVVFQIACSKNYNIRLFLTIISTETSSHAYKDLT
jgi:hypothetical protein